MKGHHPKEAATATVDYDPMECPKGDPRQLCDSLNVWGAAWQLWGMEVVAELRRLGGGGPTGVSNPPPPPFKGP